MLPTIYVSIYDKQQQMKNGETLARREGYSVYKENSACWSDFGLFGDLHHQKGVLLFVSCVLFGCEEL